MADRVPPQTAPASAPAVASARLLANRQAATGSGYSVLLTANGTGFSRLGGTILTRWSGEWSADGDGLLVLVRDLESGAFWPVGQPGSGRRATRWEPGVFALIHEQGDIHGELEVCVLPDAPAELRRLTLSNRSPRPRRLDVTTYAEVVLLDPEAHAAHPVFSKLFLQTEHVAASRALLVRRRPRSADERHPWLVHACVGRQAPIAGFETDRARFIGRGGSTRRPLAMLTAAPLSGTTGNVLDPVVSLRRTVDLEPGESAVVTFILGTADDREGALALARELGANNRAVTAGFENAQRHGEDLLRRLEQPAGEHARDHELIGALLYGRPELRATAEVRGRAAGSPTALLEHLGLDPRRPLVVVHDRDDAGAAVAARMGAALRSWRALGIPAQLVVLKGREDGEDHGEDSAPGLHILPSTKLSAAERDLLEAAAALVVTDETVPVPAPIPDRIPARMPVSRPTDGRRDTDVATAAPELDGSDLRFFNGFGGFDEGGHEYVIRLQRDGTRGDDRLRLPPRPWVNVIANDRLGCVLSETGAGVTWAGNSRQNRLTPWSNDPLLDPAGEALLIRDTDDSEAVFSCLPDPAPGPGSYEIRHGFGYSRYRYEGDGLVTDTRIFVHRSAPVRITRVRVTNAGDRSRRLSLAVLHRLVLGDTSTASGRFVEAWEDLASGALLARNRTAGPFAEHVALAAVVAGSGLVGMRRGTSLAEFAVADTIGGWPLDGRETAGFAFAAELELAPAATEEVYLLLGQESDEAAARGLVDELMRPGACAAAWAEARDFWRNGLAAIHIETPSPTLDLMVNGWLAYQTLSCRLRGRSALYQSGGAFGFRDQLQDALALLHLWPDRAREQILLHAAHQFVEGDVLHWWHPPDSRGIRTRFADDLLWLPYLTAQYIAGTGDDAVLDETLPYLRARALTAGEDEAFLRPEPAGEEGDLYDHCCRALDRSLAVGAHGLPLFGTGDWNDGMNRVGREGRGESVWMGFFLVTIIDAFAPLCEHRGDGERARRYRDHQEVLAEALNEAGWDGGWYLRGFYDDGTPFGSDGDSECRIDALVQAWSVLSGVAPPERARQALDAVEEHLVSDGERLIRLLTPPFADTPRDPGYIKGYVRGVRENGGQYTHAATWVVQAMAQAGRRHRAAALLDLLNPILHAMTPAQVERYQVEPYVMAADVYGAEPHVGRGGWTWYTGSSGCMLRVALESVLGLRRAGRDAVVLAPCVPDDWPEYRIDWRVPGSGSRYEIVVSNPDGCTEAVVAATLDGRAVPVTGDECRIPLAHDGEPHRVEVQLGPRAEAGERTNDYESD